MGAVALAASGAIVIGTRATVSPSGPRAATSPVRSTGDGTAVTRRSGRRRWARRAPVPRAGRRRARSRTRRGPSWRKPRPSCSAAVGPAAQGDAVAEPDRRCLPRPGSAPAPRRGRAIDRPAAAVPSRRGSERVAERPMCRSSTAARRASGAGRRTATSRPSRSACSAARARPRAAGPSPAPRPSHCRRPGAAARCRRGGGAGFRTGPGQGENQECRDDQAQQQKPPGRARGRACGLSRPASRRSGGKAIRRGAGGVTRSSSQRAGGPGPRRAARAA